MNRLHIHLLALGFASLLAGCGGGGGTGSVDASMNDLLDCKANPSLAICGGCATDGDCSGATPRCDTGTNKCVACLPQNDNCPKGQVCVPMGDGFACSMTCVASSDCQKLAGGGACCGGACHDTATDTKNCGACGHACDAVANGTSACAGGACTIGMCSAGFADCDKQVDNGCEISTDSDAVNCGACGKVCPAIPHGMGTCTAGACASACLSGYADCNKDVKDGCEVDTTYDIANCGGCGKACKAPANAVPFCDQGQCSFRCNPHFFDCDHDPKNGCEVNAANDNNNCGHCGNACPAIPNGTTSCMNAQCAAACSMGFGDCDRNVMNGCEAVLATDANNCGGCGMGCHNPNGSAVCSGGACTLTCNQGFFDCDNDPSNGCEANIARDPKNCGGCGMVCPMNTPACLGGKCTMGCLNGGTGLPPNGCVTGSDPQTGSTYTVCSATCNDAWIAGTNGGGRYHALEICQQFGYTKVGSIGGTCGTVCGYCQFGGQSCMNLGNRFFDGGGANCGSDQFGQILCFTVHWQCLP